jgi:hypothetical protein
MFNAERIETLFQNFLNELQLGGADRWIHIDDVLLENLGIDVTDVTLSSKQAQSYFFVLESCDKITLINQDFLVWLVPLKNESPATLAIVARNTEKEPQMELIIHASGRFNTPDMILKVLDQSLKEIKENDELVSHLSGPQTF